jgi:hypothetical protein
MARALIGVLVLPVAAALAVTIAISRRRPLRDAFRQDGDRLIAAAKGLAMLIIVTVFALLVLVNNRWGIVLSNPRLKTDVENARLKGSLVRHCLAAWRCLSRRMCP